MKIEIRYEVERSVKASGEGSEIGAGARIIRRSEPEPEFISPSLNWSRSKISRLEHPGI